jgi:hypothetical protein
MSAARTGDWPLVGHDSDPVPADPSELDEVIAHYKTMSEAMTEQAALLKRIGDGDVRLLKGQSADALRKRARESAGALDKAAARYSDVYSALDAYEPALTTARTDTWNGLLEAEKAARELQNAEGMPDPAAATRPDDAKPLTDEEKTQSSERASAISTASSGIAGAKQKVAGALEALRVAAEAASAKIRENWKVDGLHTSGWDAFVHRLNKFLKALVEILTYIGMALAVLAILIPGLNVIALIGIGVAVVSVVASVILAAQGEGSWLGVILGVLSLVGIGIAAKMANNLKGIQAIGLTKAGPVQLKLAKDKIGAIAFALRNLGPNAPRAGLRDLLSKSIGNFRSMGDFLLKQRVSPGWWHIFKNPKWVLKEDWTRLKTAWPNGAYRWDRLIGISDIRDVSKISGNLGLLGNLYQIKPWMYVGPIAYGIGWFGRPFSMLNPSFLNPFDLRNTNSGWHDAVYSGPTSENPV